MFSKAYAKGKCDVSRLCAVYVLKNFKKNPDGTLQKTNLGITVNRKLAKACGRNRAKRIIRAAFSALSPSLRDGFIIVIAARSACVQKSVKSADVSKALYGSFSKLGLLK